MSEKSARKSPPGRPFAGRDDPRNGRGPRRGAPNAGRPPNEHIAWCKGIISDPKVEEAVLKVLKNPKHPQFATLYAKLAERGYGRAVQPLSNPDGSPLPAAITVTLVPPDRDRDG